MLPIEQIVAQLAEDAHSFTLCMGMKTPGGTILVNDSTAEGAIQEYAVLRYVGGQIVQVESLTTTWCTPKSLTQLLEKADRGEWDTRDPWSVVAENMLEHGQGPCELCR